MRAIVLGYDDSPGARAALRQHAEALTGEALARAREAGTWPTRTTRG